MNRPSAKLQRRWIACIVIGMVLASAPSCGGPTFIIQQYAGPPQPKETIAVIRVHGGGPELVSLDGEPLHAAVEKGTRLHVEVLPGAHELEAAAPEMGLNRAIAARFMAEAGRVYRVVVTRTAPGGASLPDAAWSVRVYEIDAANDAPLRMAPEPPAPPPRTPPPLPRQDAGAPPGEADAT
jgi:hypothetical protein